MSDEARRFAAGLFSSRLTAADRDQIEAQTQAIGRQLFDRALAAQPSKVSTEWWVQQAGEWATQDDDLKVRLFRLVDCMPMLEDPVALDRHIREYLDDEVLARLPLAVRTALQAARSGMLAPLAARAVRAAVLSQARRFIAGTTPEEAAAAALAERRFHRGFTLDLLGEAVTSDPDADAYAAAYARLLVELPPLAARWPADPLVDGDPADPLPRVNLSLKLSALDSQFDGIDPVGTTARVLGRLRPLWRLARANGVQIHVDMESHATKDLTLAIFQQIAMEDEFRDWPWCGIVVQCYLRESNRDLAALGEWARRRGTPVWVRLVKGAYWDQETIQARAAGWPVPVWERKWQTDACFEAATAWLLEQSPWLRPAIASHNIRSLAHAMAVAGHLGLPARSVEMQMLYGMGDPEKHAVTVAGWRLRVYMPYGQLVPGMAYLVRRLLENSSNDSFLRAGFVKHVPPATLLLPPRPGPGEFGDPPEPPVGFRNEPLTDFALAQSRDILAAALERLAGELARGPIDVPLVIDGRAALRPGFERTDPGDTGRVVARVSAATPADAERAVEVAAAGLAAWDARGVAHRATVLRAAAALLRRQRVDLAALIIREVGKPWREADADVAEAIDFCEYYASSAETLSTPRCVAVPGEENVASFRPRGVGVVIAPWNFPLAILAGMTTAALVTGNAVVMKPAEQSSAVAWRLHRILLEAGVPAGVLAFLPARGEDVGPVLVSHPLTALVAFTGSRAVGLAINEEAARAANAGSHAVGLAINEQAARAGSAGSHAVGLPIHEGPARAPTSGGRVVKRVIAEMGGKNAIIVDDDADLDEAVLAVVHSAFGYQGQKCSACSRVIVLDRVHEAFLAKLAPAVASLRVGPAAEPGTRVGPLVDAEARDRVLRFVEIGRTQARTVVAVAPDAALAARGWFVGPHVFADVDPCGPLGQEEIFGPVLAAFRAPDFAAAVALANDTPYALTAGVFSRSPAHLDLARSALEAGNVYLNRGITGALVHRQPFGGYRLSGIGSKAGGPDYLQQFVVPRVVTENTLRRGFAPQRPPGGRPG